MPASTFARKSASAAASSSNLASSSSSAGQSGTSNIHPSGQSMQTKSAATLAGPHTTPAAAANASVIPVSMGPTGYSEFGSSVVGGRMPEGSSRTSSPSLSPTIGGTQASFSGSTAANHSISQSIQYNNMDHKGIHSATNSVFTTSSTATYVGASGQSDSLMREAFARRIRCLSYLKRCLSIPSYPPSTHNRSVANTPAWLDVIKLSRRDLEAIYETERMRKRTNRNHILGCSIAPTLDYSSSAEFARAILALFNEVETMGDGGEKDRAKMRNFFKSSSIRGTRRGIGGMELGGVLDGGMGIDLLGSQVPFPLDFFQTSITLCDLLVEVYHKFTLFLNNGRDVGTWNSPMAKDMDSSEAHYATVTASTLETMNKIDVKVKKLVAQMCKELDALARHVIREELASIDPLMARELGLLDGSSGQVGDEAGAHPVASAE